MLQPRRELTDAERVDWLRLIRTENVGPITFYELLQRFVTAAAALDALPELARRGGRARRMKVCSRAAAEREVEAATAAGARLVARIEPDYPDPLAAIDDAPPILTVKGHGHLIRQHCLAVVGARNASAAGLRLTRQIAGDLGAAGLVVVSGIARGIDAAAHQGSLASGTIAVLSGGIDVVYPAENADLHERVAEAGLLATEAPFGTEPKARHFPRRNRLVSGLSLGVLVVEAALKSGSLITARNALEQGREVFAVPGSPLDPRSRGANRLIRDGATLTESADDIVKVLDDMMRKPLGERETVAFGPATQLTPGHDELDRARTELMEKLGPTPVHVDELIRETGLGAPAVLTVILELELAGRIERHPGNKLSRLFRDGEPAESVGFAADD